ncbi:hypothetical protein J6590_004436, partial [Homalodisca vitripennis]
NDTVCDCTRHPHRTPTGTHRHGTTVVMDGPDLIAVPVLDCSVNLCHNSFSRNSGNCQCPKFSNSYAVAFIYLCKIIQFENKSFEIYVFEK